MKSIGSILVATDLTAMSDNVMRAAASLAALMDAKLHVLHAFDLELSPYPVMAEGRPDFQDRIRGAEQEMDAQIARTVGTGVQVARREVVIYIAHRAILDLAQTVQADLIVLGPTSKRSMVGVFLGSTADRVLRTAKVPCLVVRGPLSLPLRRVVVPLDLSSPAVGALDVALSWSAALGARDENGVPGTRLTVLHVVPHVFDAEDMPIDHEAIGSEVEREIEAARGRMSEASGVEVHQVIRWGDKPADEILAMLDQQKADLVVLATHGYGAIKRALIGSVASGVARSASCPVLLVPPALWPGVDPAYAS